MARLDRQLAARRRGHPERLRAEHPGPRGHGHGAAPRPLADVDPVRGRRRAGRGAGHQRLSVSLQPAARRPPDAVGPGRGHRAAAAVLPGLLLPVPAPAEHQHADRDVRRRGLHLLRVQRRPAGTDQCLPDPADDPVGDGAGPAATPPGRRGAAGHRVRPRLACRLPRRVRQLAGDRRSAGAVRGLRPGGAPLRRPPVAGLGVLGPGPGRLRSGPLRRSRGRQPAAIPEARVQQWPRAGAPVQLVVASTDRHAAIRVQCRCARQLARRGGVRPPVAQRTGGDRGQQRRAGVRRGHGRRDRGPRRDRAHDRRPGLLDATAALGLPVRARVRDRRARAHLLQDAPARAVLRPAAARHQSGQPLSGHHRPRLRARRLPGDRGLPHRGRTPARAPTPTPAPATRSRTRPSRRAPACRSESPAC